MTHSVINTTAITVSIQVKLHKIIYLSGFFSLTAKLQNRKLYYAFWCIWTTECSCWPTRQFNRAPQHHQ